MHPLPWVGLGVILLVPLLAVAGVFGPTQKSITAQDAGLRLEVSYPARMRYLTINELRIKIQNTTAVAAPLITVVVDRQFLENFAELALEPSADQITAEGYVIELREVPAQAERHILISFRARGHFGHSGWVRAIAEDQPALTVPMSVFVFP
jgi:hypothetical protein